MLSELKKHAAAAARKTAKKIARPEPAAAAQHVSALTVAEWCRETGTERHSVMKRLTEAKAQPVGDAAGRAAGAKLYRIGDLYRAIGGGEYEAERLRKTREEADKLALANSRARGELVEIAAVKKLGEKVMVAIRNRLLNMPLTDEEKDKCLAELMGLEKIDWTRNA
jgi:hypothetical protein